MPVETKMIDHDLVIEMHNLARRIESAGYVHIGSYVRYDADRLAALIEKSKTNKEQDNGRYSRSN
jgi:hypothetical protein